MVLHSTNERDIGVSSLRSLTPCACAASITTVLLKQLALVAAGAIASRVSGLSAVTSKSPDAEKIFASGQMASGHLPLIRTHTQTHRQM